MANGMLTLEELKAEVKAGTIDTVVAALLDMQGRLMGKRFEAKFFVDGGYEETHGCNYLLAVDVEMEPVPGYKAASWQKGYGDFVIKPDLATIRRTSMAARRPRWCSATCWTTMTMRPFRMRRAHVLRRQLKRLSKP